MRDRGTILRAVLLVVAFVLTLLPPLFINGAIGYMPVFALVLLLVCLRAWAEVCARSVQVQVEGNDVVAIRGETTRIRVRVENSCPLYVPRFEMTFSQVDSLGAVQVLSQERLCLLPLDTQELEYDLYSAHVGTFLVTAKNARVYDPLCLFSRPLAFEYARRLEVEPYLFDVSGVDVVWEEDMERDDVLTTTQNEGMEYTGVRDYQTGDSLKSIHWKLSARFEGQLTRCYTQSRAPRITLLCDFSGKADDPEVAATAYDAIVETVFSFEEFCLKHGFDVEILFSRGMVPRTINANSDFDYLEILGQMPAFGTAKEYEAVELVEQLRGSRKSNIVIVTANPNERLAGAAVRLREIRKNPVMVAVCPRNVHLNERRSFLSQTMPLGLLQMPLFCIADTREFEEGGARVV